MKEIWSFRKEILIDELDALVENLAANLMKFWTNPEFSKDVLIWGGAGTGKSFLLEKLSYYVPNNIWLIDGIDQLDLNTNRAKAVSFESKIVTSNSFYEETFGDFLKPGIFMDIELDRFWIRHYSFFTEQWDKVWHRLNHENNYVCTSEKFSISTILHIGGKNAE